MDESYTIEPFGDEWAVYEHGEYEETSVLAGQYRRCLRDVFPSIEEARHAYPQAELLDHSTRCSAIVPDVAPDWFDPANAGESWDEV